LRLYIHELAKEKYVDGILLGTTKHFELLSKKELAQPFGLKDIAKSLKNYVKQNDYKTRIMGVLNANEDSFFSGSRFDDKQASFRIESMIEDGASIIDIGAVSSRPGSKAVSEEVELERVKSSMALLKLRGAELGAPSQASSVMVKSTPATQLLLGNTPQANNFTLVDGLTQVMGGTATLFSKTGDDYIRVSTNVIKNGERAIGTKLAPSGKAIKQIQNKNAYYGAVDILGSPYLTGYEPMFDSSGNVIGIWYVGYSADLKVLEEAILQSHLLEDGFVALRDAKGNIRMHSSHVSDAIVQEALANDKDWLVTVTPFAPWGYDIILAASSSEKSALIGRLDVVKQ